MVIVPMERLGARIDLAYHEKLPRTMQLAEIGAEGRSERNCGTCCGLAGAASPSLFLARRWLGSWHRFLRFSDPETLPPARCEDLEDEDSCSWFLCRVFSCDRRKTYHCGQNNYSFDAYCFGINIKL